MNVKRGLWALLGLALCVQEVGAVPALVLDTYIGGNGADLSDEVVGNPGVYGIDSASLEIDDANDRLYVTIYTAFAGRADERRASGLTETYYGRGMDNNQSPMGIGYGDLFLSIGLGGGWDYVLSLGSDRNEANNRWKDSGVASLYRVSDVLSDGSLLNSNDFISAGFGSYRENELIAADAGGAKALTEGNTWNSTHGNSLLFSLDISGTGLKLEDGIGLHWGMTCANDVIEGLADAPGPGGDNLVPAPAAFWLLAPVLFLFAGSRLRRSA